MYILLTWSGPSKFKAEIQPSRGDVNLTNLTNMTTVYRGLCIILLFFPFYNAFR